MRSIINYFFIIVFSFFSAQIYSQQTSVTVGADLVSRYIWRGLDVNEAPNLQPSITISAYGISAGFWGSYSLDNNTSSTYSQEIDTWLSYKYQFENGPSINAILTDYYYPSAGIKWTNFNNYDDTTGAGAHTLEAGLVLAGCEKFPLTVSAYMNVYNDAGSNVYFQLDYPVCVGETPLNFFIGAAAGSEENPAYYGTEKFNVVNLGVKASRSIKITEDYSLPFSVTFAINPRSEISYLVFGLTF
ncbi:MAG: hypothetical protein WAR59_02850 [Ignavibacteriaceae bacterium]